MEPRTVILVVLAWYALASVVSFGAYAIDKRRAKRRAWRTPEATLLTIDLLGGWPGGFAAQRLIRHKNRKTWFQVRFWAIVAAHAVGWIALVWWRG